MTIYHVRFTCAPDYMARRLPVRPAHLKQLAALRDHGRVVAGGPEPDGTAAHIFYRVAGEAELRQLLEDNEFNRAGLFVANHPRPFSDFFEPLEQPAVDAGLAATLVETATGASASSSAGLLALQRQKRVAFGGLFAMGAGLAVVRSPNADEAAAWVIGACGWPEATLAVHAWSQTL